MQFCVAFSLLPRVVFGKFLGKCFTRKGVTTFTKFTLLFLNALPISKWFYKLTTKNYKFHFLLGVNYKGLQGIALYLILFLS